ncbi:MAG: HAMP domain-containing histidine kinase [Patescibacteria group bacterium]|nr:HAMP domain-containing histidine kinase [Patescibacteria group bacterium]
MAPISKQSAASATASERRVFIRARLRLTAIYAALMAVIIVGYSVFSYRNFEKSLVESSEDDFADAASQQHFIGTTLSSTGEMIFIADAVILILATGAGYVLAGYTLRPVQRSVEAQKAFAENASHELRTPLAVMRNDIEVLLRDEHPTKERLQTAMKSALEEIQGMSKMTEDLLVLARLGNHKKPEEDIDIGKLAGDLVGKMKPIASGKGISISADRPDGRLMARANAGDLERVLSNLIQNSLEHTPQGGSIAVQAAREGRTARIVVSDTGSGISERDIPHIFERFYKGQSSSGTGLGLSIAKEILERHGGSLSIESAPGKGTKAMVSLPAA